MNEVIETSFEIIIADFYSRYGKFLSKLNQKKIRYVSEWSDLDI